MVETPPWLAEAEKDPTFRWLVENSTMSIIRGGISVYVQGNVFLARPQLTKFAQTKPRKPLCVLKFETNSEITARGILSGFKRKNKPKVLKIRCTDEPITSQDIRVVRSIFNRIVQLFEPLPFKNMTIAANRPDKKTRKSFTQLHMSPAIDVHPRAPKVIDEIVETLFGAPNEWYYAQRSWMLCIDIPVQCEIDRKAFKPHPLAPILKRGRSDKFQVNVLIGQINSLRTCSSVVSAFNSVHATLILPAEVNMDQEKEFIKRQILANFYLTGVIRCNKNEK